MPNKIKVTKEDIIKASLLIVEKEGLEAVNARRIAKELNCSIQPVYYYFNTMDTLRNEIKLAIKNIYNDCVNKTKNENTNSHFKSIGIAYINFAINMPNYFKVLFMYNENYKFGLSEELDDNFEYILSTIIDEYKINKEQAIQIYENVWVATHGLAVMIATGFMYPSREKISSILTNSFKAQLLLIKGESYDRN